MRRFITLIIAASIFLAGRPLAFAVGLRIISISPSTTEIACALGLKDNLVGVSTFCDYPPEIKGIEKVGSFSEPNIEKIVSLKPDLVLATGLEQAQAVRKIKSLNIKIIEVDPKNFEELFGSIRQIASACGKEREAAILIEDMRSSIAKVSEKVRLHNASGRPKVYLEIWRDPLIVAGKGSFIDEMITLAGGDNIAYDSQRPFSQFSAELIIKRNPDVIILGYMDFGSSARKVISKRLGWQNIKAAKDGRVYDDIDPNILLRPGPRLVLGLEELYKRFYE